MQVVTLRYRCWKWINQIARIYRVLFFFFFQIYVSNSPRSPISISSSPFFFSFSSLITENEIIRRKFKKGINNTNRTFSSIVYFNRYTYIYIYTCFRSPQSISLLRRYISRLKRVCHLGIT